MFFDTAGRTTYDVGKNTFRNRWVVLKNTERIAVFHDKQKAVDYAKKKAKKNKPSEVVVEGKGVRRYGKNLVDKRIKETFPETYDKRESSFNGFVEE